jgi:hypothetical protein
MRNVLAGETASFRVDFVEDGDFFVPDQGSVEWVLRGNDGSKVTSPASVTTDSSTTYITVKIDELANQKDGEVEKRSLVVSYTRNGDPGQIILHYRLVDWLNITITPENVRSWMGITPSELPNGDIDFVRHYFEVKSDLGNQESALDEALKATTRLQYDANMAILYKAVIELVPSVQYRIAQSEQDDVVSQRRMSSLDADKLLQQARKHYADALLSVSGEQSTGPTLFTVTTGADPITG